MDSGKHEQLVMSTVSGVVVSKDTWSKTHVNGVIGNNGGYVSSSNTEVMHLFLRGDDGREFELKFDNVGVGAREGHRVSLVKARSKGSDREIDIAFVNHTTGRHEIFRDRINPLLGDAVASLNGCLFSVIAIVAILAFGTYLGQWKGPLLAIAGTAIPVSLLWAMAVTKGRRNITRQAFSTQIEGYVRSLE